MPGEKGREGGFLSFKELSQLGAESKKADQHQKDDNKNVGDRGCKISGQFAFANGLNVRPSVVHDD